MKIKVVENCPSGLTYFDKDDLESKPSRLAERKGQRPAFPFRRKPV